MFPHIYTYAPVYRHIYKRRNVFTHTHTYTDINIVTNVCMCVCVKMCVRTWVRRYSSMRSCGVSAGEDSILSEERVGVVGCPVRLAIMS